MQQWAVSVPCLRIRGSLLEGPYYDESRKLCRFIDIVDKKLHTFNPAEAEKSLNTITTEHSIGVTANVKDSTAEYIVGAQHGFALLDASSGNVMYLRRMWSNDLDGPDRERIMRSNDGAVDSHGRYWVGGMTDPVLLGEERPEGILFRLDPDLSIHRVLFGVTSPNGTGWNSDDTTMYWTDSGPRTIYAFDFDAATGNVKNRREFWNAKKAGLPDGVSPDGLAVDEHDCVWTALWRGHKVLRLNPQGVVVGEVCLPTAYVTCPVFEGKNLIITTACDPSVQGDGLDRGGDVYRVDVGIRGLPKHEFILPVSMQV